MAYPVINSPTFPSVADAPFLPPKLHEMPVFNPGVRCYECEDGVTRYMTEAEAINTGISCKAVDASRCSPPPAPGYPMVVGFPVVNLGRTMGMARISH